MAESDETCNFVRLELSNGDRVYLRSVWWTTNFSIVVFNGYQAWSHSVSTKEVVSIARLWKIDVGAFMRSARARLSCQHPTSSYSISAAEGSDSLNLSFTIDDLCEGEAMEFTLRLERISEERPVLCEMLVYLAETNFKLKEQLTEAESRFQKKLCEVAAASEPEPSITLSLARPSGNNLRCHSSAFLEPRDISKFKHLDQESRRARPHGQQQFLCGDTPTPSLDFGIANPRPHTALETEKDVSHCMNRGAAHEDRIGRTTVKMVALSPKIMQVLNSLSNGMARTHGVRDEELGDERGLKITEIRSPHREDQPQRSSFMPVHSSRHKTQTPEEMISDVDRTRAFVQDTGTKVGDHKRSDTRSWNTIFSVVNEIQDTHNAASDVILEKSSSNVGEPEGFEVNKNHAAEAVVNGVGSDEERTSKVTPKQDLVSCTVVGSNSRVKAGIQEKFVRVQRSDSNEGKRERSQYPAKFTPDREASKSVENTTGKKSSVTRHSMYDPSTTDADFTTPSASKAAQSEDEDEEMPTPARRKWSDHLTRKRSMEDEENDSWSKRLRPGKSVKIEFGDEDFLERASVEERKNRKSNTPVKVPVVELDDSPDDAPLHDIFPAKSKRDTAQVGHPSGRTIAAVLRMKQGNSAKAKRTQSTAAFRPPESRNEKGVTSVPDPDFYNFDKDRAEAHIRADQIWAVFGDDDEMPRSYARIRKVLNSPTFKASITWLKPSQPSDKAKEWSKSSGCAISCGEFEDGSKDTLTAINCFSHKMEVASASEKVVRIYPRKGEVWAIFKKSASTSHVRASKFRVAEIAEDVVEGSTGVEVVVLGRVQGYRTLWTERYAKGTLPVDNFLRFSHRVPAYRLQAHDLKRSSLKGSFWDIDPAGLPPEEASHDDN